MTYVRSSYVYFIRPVGAEGPVKIGCSSVPERRLQDLTVWSPYPLEVAAVVPGNYALEQALHNHFAHLHSHREWFIADPSITTAIAKIASGVPVAEAVDLSRSSGTIRHRGKGARPEPEYRKGYRSYSSRILWAQKKLRRHGEDSCWRAPDDVFAIMKRWDGLPYKKVLGVRPSAGEFRRLDEYLAEPAVHSVTPPWRHQKVAA